MHASSLFQDRPLRVTRIAVVVLASLGATTGALAESGRFTYVTGNVQITTVDGKLFQATAGTEVNPGDLIVTGPNGMAQLTMVDQARLSLRSGTTLRIDLYPRAKEDPPGAVLNLLRGTLRTFTTLLSKPNQAKYTMRTRVATVGIRGSGNILHQSDDDTTTTNHTIEGGHIVSDNEGKFAPIITNPNQTVQVVLGQAPKLIPTPPNLLDAGKTMVGAGKGDGPAGTSGGDGPARGADGLPTGGPTVVGGNGLGFPIIDATGNLGVDPINLQNIVIATNGTAFSDQAPPERIGLDAGALRSYTSYAGTQSGTSLGVQGGTAADVQTITIGGATTIVLGRWTGVTGASFTGGSMAVGTGGLHWGYAGAGFPSYLSDVLTGTVSYTRAGATTPTNQLGTLGQLVSSVLDVNFTARTLNASLGITMPAAGNAPAGSWTLQATNVPFALNSFVAYTGAGLIVTNGAGQSSANNSRLSGTIEGSFVGATLNGALIGYGFVDQTAAAASGFQSISGIVAFQGPSQNAAAQFRDGLVSDPTGALSSASYIRSFATTNRPDEVASGEQGRVTAFAAPYVSGNRLVGHQNYAQGSSTIVDNGFDPVTGLSWGRWSGGSATIGGQSANLSNASLHYIFGATQSGPVSLPLTGTAVYDVVGSTRPTDGVGHVGTMNNATLAANFSARTVDASVNIGINGQTWNGAANGVPIYRDQYFSAYGGGSIAGVPRPSQLVITCSPNCTPALPTGSLDGFFTGRTGRGAGVMYNLGGNSGAVAFARRGG